MAWDGSDQAMQAFEDKHGLTFPSARDDNGALYAHFGVPAQPAWVFVSADGTTELVLGAMDDAELGRRLQALGAPA